MSGRPPSLRTRLSCRQVGRVLQSYLDTELDPARAPLVAEHLEACVRCGLDAAGYRWLKAQLAGAAPPDDDVQIARLRGFADRLAAGGG